LKCGGGKFLGIFLPPFFTSLFAAGNGERGRGRIKGKA